MDKAGKIYSLEETCCCFINIECYVATLSNQAIEKNHKNQIYLQKKYLNIVQNELQNI